MYNGFCSRQQVYLAYPFYSPVFDMGSAYMVCSRSSNKIPVLYKPPCKGQLIDGVSGVKNLLVAQK